jgi:hypothetical protein
MHHLHLYNAVPPRLETDYRDTGSRSHCRWCYGLYYRLRYSWCVLRVLYLYLISPLGTLLTGAKNPLPKIDGWRMTLTHRLQHLRTRTCTRCFWAREWAGVFLLFPFFFSLQYLILLPHQYGRSDYASCTRRMLSTSSPSDSGRTAGTGPSDPNHDESPYKYVDACRCVWVRLTLSFSCFRSCFVCCGVRF